ncbi:MAG: hypothetical protein ACRC6V_06585 [Bacteroidales bacterium]
MSSSNAPLPEEVTVPIPPAYIPKIATADGGQKHIRRVAIVLVDGIFCLHIKTWWGIEVALEMGINLSGLAPKLNEFDTKRGNTYLVNKAFMSGH